MMTDEQRQAIRQRKQADARKFIELLLGPCAALTQERDSLQAALAEEKSTFESFAEHHRATEAALAARDAEATQAEQTAGNALDHIRKLVAALAALEQELAEDRYESGLRDLHTLYKTQFSRAEAAESRVVALEATLQQVREWYDANGDAAQDWTALFNILLAVPPSADQPAKETT